MLISEIISVVLRFNTLYILIIIITVVSIIMYIKSYLVDTIELMVEQQITFFSDIAGLTEAKSEVKLYVDVLKNRDKYLKMGAKLPRGLLMVGPPGCGKTLLARAIAGEANCNFMSVNGSQFDEVYVGVGASRIRDLFARARAMGQCIIFIDEIDSIGARRGTDRNTEYDRTLNNLLTEMDGFKSTDNILVIGATNRIDILDDALLRSGRFDQKITVDRPLVDDRSKLFHLYLSKIKLDPAIDILAISCELAKLTTNCTGADIHNICNQAAILAVDGNCETIGRDHLFNAMDNILIGGTRKSRKVTNEEKKIVAYHECGHAMIGYLLKHSAAPLTISIVPRGEGMLGYTKLDDIDKLLKTKMELIEEIACLMGGRIAEEIVFSDITGGASNDIERATNIAYSMVTQLGMHNKVGKVQIGKIKPSDQTLSLVDTSVRELIDDIYDKTKQIMITHRENLDKLALFLLDREIIRDTDIEQILGSDTKNSIEITI